MEYYSKILVIFTCSFKTYLLTAIPKTNLKDLHFNIKVVEFHMFKRVLFSGSFGTICFINVLNIEFYFIYLAGLSF